MDVFAIFMLLGGLGMFIYGMKIMSEGLEAAAGDKMRRWLEVLTKNRFAGVAVGAGATVMVQSSSAVTVMVVGFVNAGLMTLKQAVSVCMGANIGTTVTAQIIAFKISDVAPLILFLGVLMMMFIKDRTIKQVGQIVVGFGILFLGMDLMSGATAPLAQWQPFRDVLATFTNPLVGILAGAAFTAVIQASGATMGILLALATTGVISLDNSIYVILGLNIGTCITAVLASLGANKTAKRTAVVHVLFNVFGTLIFLVLLNIFPIKEWIYNLSPDSVERQLANFHMIFNIVTTAILIWFPSLLIKLSYLIIRGEDPQPAKIQVQYIGSANMDNPSLSVGLALKEVNRMAGVAMENFNNSLDAFLQKDVERVKGIEQQESLVNFLNHSITDFLAKLSQEELGKVDGNSVAAMFHVINDVERISDHAENMAEFTNYEMKYNVVFSEKGLEELTYMMNCVKTALKGAVDALRTGDISLAVKVIEIEKEIDELEIALKDHHVERMARGECSPRASMIYSDLVTNLERVADHSTNIAWRVIEDGIYKRDPLAVAAFKEKAKSKEEKEKLLAQ